jgi:hypothetical protein
MTIKKTKTGSIKEFMISKICVIFPKLEKKIHLNLL